jgi:ferredoxin-nitrite reductase
MQTLQNAKDLRSKKLNKIEDIKNIKSPMDVYAKLKDIANLGYENLSKEDSSYFLKCFGLFDKGEDFMLRVRIPAGVINYQEALTLANVAKTYGDDYIDLTTRMQVELRYIAIKDIGKVLSSLKDSNLSTFQTGVDNPRNILTDPLDGISYDNIIETKPLIDKLTSTFIQNPEWISQLPRKFNTAILGSLSNSCNIFGHDCCFVLANCDGEFGFNIYLGARVGVQAQDADLFVSIDEVEMFFHALLKVFRDFGYRDNRNKNRLHFLLKDVGVKAFIDGVKKEANCEFKPAGVTMVQSKNIALGSNRVLQKNGLYAYKLIVPSGIFSGSELFELANRAKEFATGDLRFTYDQNIYIINIPKESIEEFENSQIIQKYKNYNNIFFQDMIACAGTKTCSFGVIPNKPDAIDLANFLNSELKIESGSIRMNWSACPKGCGVHGIADIGFEGCKAKDDDGNRVDGVHLFVGGKITKEAKEAKILHKALPITEAKYHAKYLLKNYATHKNRAESYEDFDDRFLKSSYTLQAIAFFTKINYILNDKYQLDTYLPLNENPKSSKVEEFEVFSFGLKLFKLLTGEDRFKAVENFEPVLERPRKIKEDEVTTLNPKVPKNLSHAIYLMTHENHSQRAKVFSEVLRVL